MEIGRLYQIEVVWKDKPKENFIFPEGTSSEKARNEFDLIIATAKKGQTSNALILWELDIYEGCGWRMVDEHAFT